MKKSEKVSTILLSLHGLMFLFFGIIFLIDPVKSSEFIYLKLLSVAAKVEITAMYGGLNLGLGLFFLICVSKKELLKAGLLSSALVLLGLGLTRSVAILSYGSTERMMIFFAIVEIIWGSLFIYLFKNYDKRSQ